MTTHFASAFDKNFVIRALATYRSIVSSIPEAHFWFLCLDSETRPMIEKFNLKNITCITVEEIGNSALLATRKDRTNTEFAMTSKSNFLSYLFHSGKVKDNDLLILTDVDMIFYEPLREFIEKEKKNTQYSIFLTPHKFPKEKEKLIPEVGYYNGGFITFRINEVSKACIDEWAGQCINWCYLWHDYEHGWHTDQMYIDKWKTDYPGALDLPDKGVNMGTWNIERFTITQNKNGEFFADEDPVICYHFHGLKMYITKAGKIKAYPICIHNNEIYTDYITKLQKVQDEILKIDPQWKYGYAPHPGILRLIKQIVWRKLGLTKYNISLPIKSQIENR